MGYFERRLLRPTHLEVVQALEEASAEANETIRVSDRDRDFWWRRPDIAGPRIVVIDVDSGGGGFNIGPNRRAACTIAGCASP